MHTPFLFVYVTHPNLKEAKELAKKCLEEKLIACANIFPQGVSLYRWQGKVCEDQEWVLILKTDRKHFVPLEKLIKKDHPYECPCIMAIPIGPGSEEYKSWLESSLGEYEHRV